MEDDSVGNEITEECIRKIEDDLAESEIVQGCFEENYVAECSDGNIPITEAEVLFLCYSCI